jgi:hypothetical protein
MAHTVIADTYALGVFGFTFPFDSLGVASFGFMYSGTTDPNKITNHADRAVSLLIEQFEKKPLLTGTLRAFVNQLQVTENQLSDVLILRFLDNATGAQLDGMGDIVGLLSRADLGLSEEDYKALIGFRIYVNSGAGEASTVLNALAFITQATTTKLVELFPAAIELETNGTVIPDDLIEIMQAIVGAGVRLDHIARVPEDPFILASTTQIPPDSEGLGFTDITNVGGGHFAGVVT